MDLRTVQQRMTEEFAAAKESRRDPSRAWNFIVLEDGEPEPAPDMVEMILGGEAASSRVLRCADMFDILVEMAAFKSKRDAKANWQKTDKDVEVGCSSFMVGKKEVPLFVWRVPKGFR